MTTQPSKLRRIIENDASINPFGADSLTVTYASQGELLTKRILPDGSERSYDHAFTFYCAPVDVSTTEKLLALLQALAPSRHACIILGAIAPHVDRKRPIRRLVHPRPEAPIPTFRAVPRSVFALDVDSIEAPSGLDLKDLRAAAKYVRRQLPAAFHDVEIIAVATSGHLRKPGLRFRMWVRLSRPLYPKEMKRWMLLTKPENSAKPRVDLSVFNPVQPNYTADPVFDDPKMDPLPGGRILLLPGRPYADVPSEDELFDLREWFERPGRNRPQGSRDYEKHDEKSGRSKGSGAAGAAFGSGTSGATSGREDAEGQESAREYELDPTYAHLWDDNEAIAITRSYLADAAHGVKGEGRHNAALKAYMRALDFGLTPSKAIDLLLELWSPRCKPPYVDREELAREVGGAEYNRERPIGCDHPRAFEQAPGDAGRFYDPPPNLSLAFIDSMPLEKARDHLRRLVVSIFDDFLKPDSAGGRPVYGLPAGVGVGKTEKVLETVVASLLLLRERKRRDVAVFACPTHRLSNELRGRFIQIVERVASLAGDRARARGHSERFAQRIEQRARLSIAIWRGREAENPDKAGHTMCENVTFVREAQALHIDVEKKLCPRCPYREDCAYLAQSKRRADFWILTHSALFNGAPKPIKNRIGFVVIDESVEKSSLFGVGSDERKTEVSVALEAFSEGGAPLPESNQKIRLESIERFRRIRESLFRALRDAPAGPVSRVVLLLAGISWRDALFAAWFERSRIYRGDDVARQQANRTVTAMVRVWQVVAHMMHPDGPETSGWLRIEREEAGVREIRLRGFRPIHKDYRKPTLMIDASLDGERIKPLFPEMKVIERIRVDMPHVKVWQSGNRAFSKSMLEPLRPKKGGSFSKDEAAEDKRRAGHRDALRINITNLARGKGGKVLVVANKSVVEALNLPSNIAVANFNNIAGRDEWKDHRSLVIIGRPLPPPAAVEDIAAAFSGSEPKRIAKGNWYVRRKSARILRTDSFFGFYEWPAEGIFHPDEMVDRHLKRICNEEIMQVVGRLRGVSRTAENPAEIFVLNNLVLEDLPINGLFNADAFLTVTPAERMLARGGLALGSADHAFLAYPGLWPTVAAARKAFQRSRKTETNPYKELLIGKCPAVPATYQLKGARHKKKRCRVDLSLCPNPRAQLEAWFGELSFFEIQNQS